MSVTGPAITVGGLRKAFTQLQGTWPRRARVVIPAVDDVTFAIERGSIVGYIGPNGAGKSTTVKMLTGILVPSGGKVSVLGLEPTRQRVDLAKRIGVMFGQRVQLWWDLPLIESFELLRHVYRIPDQPYRRNMEEVRAVLELDPFLRTPVRQLSLGQRVRGELAAALLHDPEVIFLDEPTIGLDVLVKQRVRELLLRVNAERGVTIFLTTHDLADIERLCTRVLLLDHGKLAFDGTVPELSRRFGHRRVLMVELEVPAQPFQLEGATVIRVEGPRQWIAFDGDRTTAAQLVGAISTQAAIRDLAVQEPEIEEVVRRIYGGRTGV